MKYLNIVALFATLAFGAACSHGVACKKSHHACQTAECKADKSCCENKCGECTGEKNACKGNHCAQKTEEKKS
jgi:hypothetical protein